MIKKRFALLCLIASSLYSQGIFAQNVIKIDLDKAIEIAINDNPTIKIADLEVTRQEYVKKTTQGALLPNVTGSGSYTYNLKNPVLFLPDGLFGPGTGGPIRMGFNNSFTGGASLSVPLYMPTIYKTLQLNEEQIRSAVENLRGSKVSLVNQVKKSYYSILLGESALSVVNSNIEYAGVVVQNTRNAYEQGTMSEFDLITAEVQQSNLKPTVMEIENSIRISRLMLNMLLALPLDMYIETEETLYSFENYIKSNPDNILDYTDNVDLNLLQIQQKLLQRQFELQRFMRYPSLSGIANYQVQSQSNNLRIGSYQWTGSSLAGLQLSVPIFAGLQNVNTERQIKTSIAELKIQEKYLEDNVGVQAQTAISNIQRAREQMMANEIAMNQATKGYKIAETRFNNGAGTIIEVNAAQMAFLQARLNYSQSIYDYMSTKADFDQIMGKIR